jgi:conjugative transfer signal peptidase TraF
MAAVACALALLWALGRIGLRINASPSLPIGVYVRTSNPGATLAEFCPDEPAAKLAITRGYRSRGNCPDGGTPLLKPVIATEGDLVELSDAGITVNGTLLINTEPQRDDTRGRRMPRPGPGIFRVAPGTVWVASSYNRRSFDSRYMGPIRVAAIRHFLRPVWTE